MLKLHPPQSEASSSRSTRTTSSWVDASPDTILCPHRRRETPRPREPRRAHRLHHHVQTASSAPMGSKARHRQVDAARAFRRSSPPETRAVRGLRWTSVFLIGAALKALLCILLGATRSRAATCLRWSAARPCDDRSSAAPSAPSSSRFPLETCGSAVKAIGTLFKKSADSTGG